MVIVKLDHRRDFECQFVLDFTKSYCKYKFNVFILLIYHNSLNHVQLSEWGNWCESNIELYLHTQTCNPKI